MRSLQGHKVIWHNQEKTKNKRGASDPDESKRKKAKFKGICADGGAQRSVGGLMQLLKLTGSPKQILEAPAGICSMPGMESKELPAGAVRIRFPKNERGDFCELKRNIAATNAPILLGGYDKKERKILCLLYHRPLQGRMKMNIIWM